MVNQESVFKQDLAVFRIFMHEYVAAICLFCSEHRVLNHVELL